MADIESPFAKEPQADPFALRPRGADKYATAGKGAIVGTNDEQAYNASTAHLNGGRSSVSFDNRDRA